VLITSNLLTFNSCLEICKFSWTSTSDSFLETDLSNLSSFYPTAFRPYQFYRWFQHLIWFFDSLSFFFQLVLIVFSSFIAFSLALFFCFLCSFKTFLCSILFSLKGFSCLSQFVLKLLAIVFKASLLIISCESGPCIGIIVSESLTIGFVSWKTKLHL
jgi:hypothetical protein